MRAAALSLGGYADYDRSADRSGAYELWFTIPAYNAEESSIADNSPPWHTIRPMQEPSADDIAAIQKGAASRGVFDRDSDGSSLLPHWTQLGEYHLFNRVAGKSLNSFPSRAPALELTECSRKHAR